MIVSTNFLTSVPVAFGRQGNNSQDLLVQAPDDATLSRATQQVMTVVTKHTQTTNVQSDLSSAAPLIDIHVDPARAALHGLTSIQVAQLLQTTYSGITVTHVRTLHP